jgi:hypothetical protein
LYADPELLSLMEENFRQPVKRKLLTVLGHDESSFAVRTIKSIMLLIHWNSWQSNPRHG